jgi:predicted tellurium resistance membrane protein TerC
MSNTFFSTDSLLSLITLTLMEIVLGIDNVVFISIVTGKLPKEQQLSARRLGIFLALFIRIVLLGLISYIVNEMVDELFVVFNQSISWRDIILLSGGIFLIYKSTVEIYEKLEHDAEETSSQVAKKFWNVVGMVIVIDIVFSFDSIITAVGLANELSIMVTAVIISMIIMLIFSHKIGNFINEHPSMKILALAFLLLIGSLLVAEAFDYHVPKGYIYFAMFFSVMVELLNMRFRKNRSKPVQLNDIYK